MRAGVFQYLKPIPRASGTPRSTSRNTQLLGARANGRWSVVVVLENERTWAVYGGDGERVLYPSGRWHAVERKWWWMRYSAGSQDGVVWKAGGWL
jgi:hypothetical protein